MTTELGSDTANSTASSSAMYVCRVSASPAHGGYGPFSANGKYDWIRKQFNTPGVSVSWHGSADKKAIKQ